MAAIQGWPLSEVPLYMYLACIHGNKVYMYLACIHGNKVFMYLACIHDNKVYVTILIVSNQHGSLSLSRLNLALLQQFPTISLTSILYFVSDYYC